MKNILARGGIEFLAVFIGIILSLWVDDKRNLKSIRDNNYNTKKSLKVEIKLRVDYIETKTSCFEFVNLGSGIGYSVFEIIRQFELTTGCKIPFWPSWTSCPVIPRQENVSLRIKIATGDPERHAEAGRFNQLN